MEEGLHCVACFRVAPSKRCSRCGAHYCSSECQLRDWHDRMHAVVCHRTLRARVESLAALAWAKAAVASFELSTACNVSEITGIPKHFVYLKKSTTLRGTGCLGCGYVQPAAGISHGKKSYHTMILQMRRQYLRVCMQQEGKPQYVHIGYDFCELCDKTERICEWEFTTIAQCDKRIQPEPRAAAVHLLVACKRIGVQVPSDMRRLLFEYIRKAYACHHVRPTYPRSGSE